MLILCMRTRNKTDCIRVSWSTWVCPNVSVREYAKTFIFMETFHYEGQETYFGELFSNYQSYTIGKLSFFVSKLRTTSKNLFEFATVCSN